MPLLLAISVMRYALALKVYEAKSNRYGTWHRHRTWKICTKI